MAEKEGQLDQSSKTGGEIDPRWDQAKRGEPVQPDDDPSHYDLHRERKRPPKKSVIDISWMTRSEPEPKQSDKPWNEAMVAPIGTAADGTPKYREVNRATGAIVKGHK